MNRSIRRGDIWWVRLDSRIGGEIKKERPAVVVSNNSSNKHLNRVQLIPLSSHTGKVFPSEAVVTIKGLPNKAMADQIMTASKQRLSNKIGSVTKKELLSIEAAIRIQLAIS
jgi:mRNA interferase MazF